LARLCVFGTAMSIKKVFFVFLFMNVTSGQLKGIVLSVSTLRFQYSMKLLLLLLLLSSSSVSPLYRVSTLIFLRQTMSLGNTVLQLF
jgi:hypothetical protein